ncbi:hypothetical protein F4680DRAFT_122693 [Xylaria scruposa]|nr:hypothetical protein F4680DRAFT_122693 [Xylaria scruposa]
MCVVNGFPGSRAYKVVSPTTYNFKGLLREDQESNNRLFTDSYEVNDKTPLGIPKKYVASIVPNTESQEATSQQSPGCQNIGWTDRASYLSSSWLVDRYWWLYTVKRLDKLGPSLWGFRGLDKLDEALDCLGRNIFTTIFNAAYYSGITECGNQMCKERKKAFEAAAPECSWSPFRDFILTCLACNVGEEGWSFFQEIVLPMEEKCKAKGIPGDFIYYWMLYERNIPSSFCIDIRGILDLCRWSSCIVQDTPKPDARDIGIVPSNSRLKLEYCLKVWLAVLPEYENNSLSTSKTCEEKGLCPNRLWNVSFHGPNTSVGVCLLEKASQKIPPLNSRKSHIDCSAQHCLRAHDNSTGVQQAHKCEEKACSDISFPGIQLNQASEGSNGRWFNTAWRLQPNRKKQQVMAPEENEYMAISHVWSDGTGVGVKTYGQVNQCLYRYFAKIAKSLNCSGLWWDTISIPSDRAARATAIERMLENFERAKVTLVHDEELVNFPWSNDGSPAIALVLSSWFTRGWTAAELFASRNHKVKVLFADPDNLTGDPLIKDLDDDVFMGNKKDTGTSNIAGTIPMPGYFVAADAMRRIRGLAHNRGAIKKLSDLVNILSHRTTSWARDHMLIAGLMCETLNARSDHSGFEITKLILSRLSRIDVPDLFHAEVPAATYGGWSWCPQSIYGLGQLYHSSSYVDIRCRVFPDGRLTGRFQPYEILENDKIAPCGSHPALKARISLALSNRKSCLLLSTPHNQQDQLYILAQPVFMNGCTISCRWIACVRLQSPLSGRRREIHLSSHTYFRFGNDMSLSGAPLPPMSFDDLCSVSLSFRTNSNRYQGHRTICENHPRHPRKNKNTRNWRPQLVYFYDYQADHDEKIENSEYNFSPSRPSAHLAWDPNNEENMIRESFFEILKSVVHVGEMKNDQVTLLWSFPHKVVKCCSKHKNSIFRTQFHRVPKILIQGKEHDISLGRKTYEESIKELLETYDGHSVIWSCRPCRHHPKESRWEGDHDPVYDIDVEREGPTQEDIIYRSEYQDYV